MVSSAIKESEIAGLSEWWKAIYDSIPMRPKYHKNGHPCLDGDAHFSLQIYALVVVHSA